MKLINSKIIAVIGLMIGGISVSKAETPPTVFSAASLTASLPEYAETKGIKTQFSFASSGALARQIAAGAPADIFISANIKWADWLTQTATKRIVKSKTFLGNSLAIVSSSSEKRGIKELFTSNEDFFIAIGDPNHTPAGIYAKQSLEAYGLWDVVQGKLASSSNVRAALYLVQTGAADYGIVYKSDAIQSKSIHLIEVLPSESHTPIRYKALMFKSSEEVNPLADSFFAGLDDEATNNIWVKYGFQPLKN